MHNSCNIAVATADWFGCTASALHKYQHELNPLKLPQLLLHLISINNYLVRFIQHGNLVSAYNLILGLFLWSVALIGFIVPTIEKIVLLCTSCSSGKLGIISSIIGSLKIGCNHLASLFGLKVLLVHLFVSWCCDHYLCTFKMNLNRRPCPWPHAF